MVWRFRSGFTACGKSPIFCHTERSEESLFDLSPRKEGERDSSLRSEGQKVEFFRGLFSLRSLNYFLRSRKPHRLKPVLPGPRPDKLAREHRALG